MTLLPINPIDRERVSVFAVADGSTVARPLPGSGFHVTAAETDRTFWVFGQHGHTARIRAAELDRTGQVLRRAVLPAGWFPGRGVTGGLLLTRPRSDGSALVVVWDPQRRRVVRTVSRGGFPVAETSSQVAWPDRLCATASEGCVLHVTNLRTGDDAVIPLPRGLALFSGSFSPDGKALVLTMSESQTDGGGSVFVVSVDSANVIRVADGTPHDVGATVDWTPSGDGVVLSATAGTAGTALAVWRWSASRLEIVPGHFDAGHVLAVRPAS